MCWVYIPEGLASMTWCVIGELPGSPLDQWMVRAEPYREMKGSPGGPGAPAWGQRLEKGFRVRQPQYTFKNIMAHSGPNLKLKPAHSDIC